MASASPPLSAPSEAVTIGVDVTRSSDINPSKSSPLPNTPAESVAPSILQSVPGPVPGPPAVEYSTSVTQRVAAAERKTIQQKQHRARRPGTKPKSNTPSRQRQAKITESMMASARVNSVTVNSAAHTSSEFAAPSTIRSIAAPPTQKASSSSTNGLDLPPTAPQPPEPRQTAKPTQSAANHRARRRGTGKGATRKGKGRENANAPKAAARPPPQQKIDTLFGSEKHAPAAAEAAATAATPSPTAAVDGTSSESVLSDSDHQPKKKQPSLTRLRPAGLRDRTLLQPPRSYFDGVPLPGLRDSERAPALAEFRAALRISGATPLQTAAFKLEVYINEAKGRCVRTLERIPRAKFVCEYAGDLITRRQAEEREHHYAFAGKGCYMYHFEHTGGAMCVDATEDVESWGFGRLINHSRTKSNVVTLKALDANQRPHLGFFSMCDIEADSELLYDYGDRVAQHNTDLAWLKT